MTNEERFAQRSREKWQALNRKRIVAEISKNWPSLDEKDSSILASRFEVVIETNRKKGFILESWQMTQNATLGGVYETIIAVFIEA